jgi:phosphate transport system permease protein
MEALRRLARKRRRQDALFGVVGFLCTFVGIVTLLVLLADLAITGLGRINWQFLTSFPSRFPDRAGILSAWVGSLAVILVTVVLAITLGVAAGVYLEEYAPRNRLTALIEINIANLAGVPSILYGLLALGLLVYGLGLGRSILVGGITLALLILPIVIVATREALRSIPQHIREAAYALGATKWQVIWHHLLPYSTGGISTGIIIGTSRALGETAPLITIGALTFIAFLPPSPITSDAPFVNLDWLDSPFTVLPIQMFNWVSRPGDDFLVNAAATGLVLIFLTLTLNSLAIVIRYRMRKRIHW